MNDVNSQQSYYNKYWIERGDAYSGDRTGYAPNLRHWMAAKLTGFPEEEEILEVGCGDASFTKNPGEFSKRVSAIDLSSEQIAVNQEKYPAINFLTLDPTNLLLDAVKSQ